MIPKKLRLLYDYIPTQYRLATNGFFAQLISTISYILIMHNYSSSDYGFYAWLLAISSLIIPISNLRVDQLFSEQQNEFSVTKLARIGIYSSSFFGGIGCISYFILIFFNEGNNLESLNKILFCILIICSTNLASIVFNLFIYFNLKNEVTFWPILQNLTFLISLFCFEFLGDYRSILISYIVSRLLPVLYYSKKVISLIDNHYGEKSFLRLRELFTRIIQSTLVAFADQSFISIPILVLSKIFDFEKVGAFSLALTFLFSPISLLSSSISTALLFEVSKKTMKERASVFHNFVYKYFKETLKITFGFIIIYILVGFYFMFVFKNGWYDFGITMVFYSFSFSLLIFWNPIASMLQSFGFWSTRLKLSLIQGTYIAIPLLCNSITSIPWNFFVFLGSISSFAVILISIRTALNRIFGIL